MDEQRLREQIKEIKRLREINADLLAACKDAAEALEYLMQIGCADRENNEMLLAAIAKAETTDGMG